MTARLKSPRLIVSLTCIRPRGQVKSSAFSIYPRSSPRRRNVARSLQKNLSKEIWKIGAGDARNINVAAFWKTVPSIKQHLVDVLDRDHMGHVSRDTVEQSGCPAFSLVLIVEPILTQQRRDFGSKSPFCTMRYPTPDPCRWERKSYGRSGIPAPNARYPSRYQR